MQQFFIAIVLPLELNKKILVHKRWMQQRYGCRVGLRSPAHITLIPPFWSEPAREEEMKRDLQLLSDKFRPFELHSNHFSAFAPRTLFVAVKENMALSELKITVDHFFRHTDYGIKIDKRPFHPHITIATRDLHKKDFADAWPHFEKRKFEETFQVSGLSLLRHNGACWEVVFTSTFSG